MVVHDYNPSTWETEAGGAHPRSTYVVRPCLKKIKKIQMQYHVLYQPQERTLNTERVHPHAKKSCM
jgi:hypothetical protein